MGRKKFTVPKYPRVEVSAAMHVQIQKAAKHHHVSIKELAAGIFESALNTKGKK